MYPGNTYVSLLGVILIFVSLFFLFRMTLTEYELHKATIPRFLCFITEHFFGIVMLIKLVYQKNTQEHITWGLQISGVNSVLMIFTESYIRINYLETKIDSRYQPLQLGFLNCYFLVFMYSLIGLVLTSAYLIFMRSIEYWQARKIESAISRFIIDVPYEQEMDEFDCPICLLGFDTKDSLAKVQCSHLFHRQCLVEWIKINQNCPMCRKKFDSQASQRNQQVNNPQMV